MIKYITAGIAAASIAVTAFALPAHATVKPVPVNWTARTCTALTAWEHKRSTAHLDRLVTDSLHLRHGYLASDVAQLLAAVVAAKPDPGSVDIADQYAGEDCYGGA